MNRIPLVSSALRGTFSAAFSPRQLSLAALGAAAVLTASPAASAAVELNGIAAKVNGKVVTKKEVAFNLAPTISLLRAKYPRRGEGYRKAFEEAQEKVIEHLIDNALVLSKLEELDADLPDYVIDEEVNRIVREVFNGNEAEFRKNLEQTGMTRRAFRKSQKEKILIQAFRQQQFKDVAPATESEILAHYKKRRSELRDRSKDTITFRKIFIPALDQDNPANTPEDQLALAEKLTTEIKGGADFATVAKEYSKDAFAEDGGLWEPTERPDLDPGFGDIVFDGKEGEILGPMKDPRGFTIVRVIKITDGPAPGLDKKLKERMRTEVEIEKRTVRYKKWLDDLKRKAMIERRI